MSRITVRSLLALVALALMVALPAAATAKRHSTGHGKSANRADRNRDGLPDKWERRHHLSLKVKQASRDQDRDGSNNAMEFAANTNPRDKDSDDDGVKDGAENVGTVVSFTDGVLVISSGGLPVSGKVTDATEIRCGVCGRDGHRRGDDHGDDEGDDDGPFGDRRGSASRHGDEFESEREDGPFGDRSGTGGGMPTGGGLPTGGGMPTGGGLPGRPPHRVCSVADLKPGTIVREAELKLTSAGPVWDEIKIVPPTVVPAAG